MGDPSDLVGVKLAPPAAPEDFYARAVDQQESIDLFWKMPENDGEPAVTGYRIEWTTDDPDNPGTLLAWSDLEADYSGRAYRHRNLTAGVTYHYRVRALNGVSDNADDGPGGPTTDVVMVISSNKARMPRNLVATLADDMMSVHLAWDGPVAEEGEDGDPANGGSPIKGYKIEASTDGGTTWADVVEDMEVHPESDLLNSAPGSEFEYTHSGLNPGTSYMYRVSAFTDAGPGHPSDVATTSTDAVEPGMPMNLTATASDMGAVSIKLEWMAPASNGGADITSWKIEVSEDLTADPVVWTELDLTVTETDSDADPPVTTYSVVHTGLNAQATYHYRVSATNSVGTGDPSEAAMATTADIPAAPTGLTATADGETTINLSWTAPADNGSSAVAGYKIESSPDGADDSWTDLEANTGNTDVEYADTGLDPGTPRHYRVSAMIADGTTGAASDPANATTAARGIVTRYARFGRWCHFW